MRFAVCIKQVPVVAMMKFDPVSRTLKREGVATEVSSFDVRALLKAIELRDLHGGEVVVLTMGPPQAREALDECLALGADRAVLLTDRAFAGSDTLATARVLAAALRREAPDLILCGRYSVDAETGQVGPEVAELLGIPQITALQSIVVDVPARRITATRETDSGTETVVATLPLLITATEDLAAERFPSKADREAAKAKVCTTLSHTDLGLAATDVGSGGSPTWVAELQDAPTQRRGILVEGASVADATRQLARILVHDVGLFRGMAGTLQPTLATLPQQVARSGAKDVWVIVETADQALRAVSLELLGKARDLADVLQSSVTALCAGHQLDAFVPILAAHGADRVLLADDAALSPYTTDVHADVIADAIRRGAPGIVLMGATNRGRDLAPRLAARLQLGLTGDCIDLGLDAEGRLLQYKPAFGGSVVAPILSRTIPEMATVRPGMMVARAADTQRRAATEKMTVHQPQSRAVQVVGTENSLHGADALDTADIIIGVGMGLGDAAAIAGIRPLAQRLGAALCTTRDVVDAGWLPRHLQVGLTGRAVAPKLYIGIAIRGAFEHMVGLRRAGVIVAINKNAKAPVFKQADYGIVGDYREVVAALDAELARLSGQA